MGYAEGYQCAPDPAKTTPKLNAMSHRYANTALAYRNEYGEATTDEAEADSGPECCLSDGYREGPHAPCKPWNQEEGCDCESNRYHEEMAP